MTQSASPRLAIIGAGPIGLEAALAGVHAGFDVQVYERGEVAEHVRDWGHVTLFTPFGMNSSEAGRAAVKLHSFGEIPSPSDLLTGQEYVEKYLLSLSWLPELKGRIHEGTTVHGVSRSRLLKGDAVGAPHRGDDRFRLLLANDRGDRSEYADFIFDCGGVYGRNNWIGAGGLPAEGEEFALSENDYRLPDILEDERPRFARRRTLVVGGGFSAATAVVALAEVAEDFPGTSAVWITRTDRTPPMERIEDDALPERDRLAAAANELALDSNSPIEWRPGRTVESISNDLDSYDVELNSVEQGSRERLRVDRVIANVGYRPDRDFYEELQVHECYATQGPMKLAAALMGETSPDCLAQTSHGPETLCHPEPGFFILGAKSYGRDSRFLINIGLQQIRDVIALISK